MTKFNTEIKKGRAGKTPLIILLFVALIVLILANLAIDGRNAHSRNEIKEKILGVSHDVLEEKTAVCEEVAIAMVKGAINALGVDYAISATGVAGPSGGTAEIPVGTIWLACGSADDIVTVKIEQDKGRELNLSNATTQALQLFLDYLKERLKIDDIQGDEGNVKFPFQGV